MTKEASSPHPTTKPKIETTSNSNDWFLSAITTNGSVGMCLQNVILELEQKRDFIAALTSNIAEPNVGAIDRISELAARIRTLENTLKFRLTILSPERKGAWFRASTATSGPFKENLLSDPVFSPYDEDRHALVAKGFMLCWAKENLVDYPLKASEPSLWLWLLKMNFELASVSQLQSPWPNLLNLPENLPANLESRSLRLFLTNVRTEIVASKARLSDCYRILLSASEQYWRFHATSSAKKESEFTGSRHENPYTFKPRSYGKATQGRERGPTISTPRTRLKTSSDLEALKFMGFQDFPDFETLRTRYHALAREMHPDISTGSEQKFKMLNRSYKHLSKVVGA